ncbi:hypothetical protein ACS4RR_006270 [Rhizobium sp. Z1P35]
MSIHVLDILKSLRDRTPWPVARRILQQIGVERSKGWDLTLERADKAIGRFESKEDDILEALRLHAISGEKLASFYEVGAETMATIRERAAEIVPPSNPFSESYPVTLSETALKGMPAGLVLAAVERTETGTGLVFASARVVTVREPISLSSLGNEIASELDDYEEIIGVKTVSFQAFDVVWIPDKGSTMDVRVDFPEGTLGEVALAARKLSVEAFESAIGVALPEPTNVFALIDRMYGDGSEGIVVELGFGTTTASIKREKMRRKKLDLRNETYHKGGKAALGTPIEPFKVSIIWRRPVGPKLFSEPELSLNSNSRAAGSADPVLDRVVIRKCMGNDDFDYVRSRIAHHLGW